ncbi:MAG: sulfur carrier protein ThiS [Planctomycetota bacterium]|nr:thiamine biosynthesis protein ThiS [Planctomycetota bacterium]MDP6370816.1 sulfur carrier protein ThiS [Planctomycetota bacterium]MDP6521000.1 sulfur carrier protein ThiS [Planctomycetota bacterium]MDP6838601.1 sulfur carrier protein ThiS [Planctomycetota bacterium]
MHIYLNGDDHECPSHTTVEDLVLAQKLAPALVAVEINCELVPRTQRPERVLAQDDRVEIVTLVGGG